MRPAQAKKASSSVYGVHPGVAMVQKWVDELKGKTGRSLDEWVALARREGPKSEKDRREWLRINHKLGTNSAWWIAARVDGRESEEDSPQRYLAAAPKYVDGQYSGKKQALRPLYEDVLALAGKLGADVKACPCKTIVPLYRKHVFAQLKPTTNTRLDLGLALGRYKGRLPKRVVDTGGLAKKDRITHRIELKTAAAIDREVEKWLKTAYDLDAG
jgi:Domain of unknown function (DUF5655)/Domain of unknown function (DUF4287)